MEEPEPLNSCNKTSFARVFCGEDIHVQRLQTYIQQCHNLSFHATHVLKLYAIQHDAFETNFTKKIIVQTLHLLNDDYRPRNTQDIETANMMREAVQSYRQHVSNCTPIGMKYVQQTIHYLGAGIYTNMVVNVQSHFTKMLLKYINKRLDVRSRISQLKVANIGTSEFYSRVRKLKEIFTLAPGSDTLLDEFPLSDEEEILRYEILSVLPYGEPQDNVLAYVVASKPDMFVSSYCRLSSYMEAYGYPQFSALPLRRSHVLSHAPIDTKILCTQIYKESSLIKGMMENKEALWSKIFNLKNKAFKSRSGFLFNGMIKTDGTSVSVHLEKNRRGYGRKRKRKSKAVMEEQVKNSYFEKHITEIQKRSNYVVIDPNKRDLLYCRDAKDDRVMRYTSSQRAVETRSRKYRKLRERLRRSSGIDVLESTIPTHKTMNMTLFVSYLQAMDGHFRTAQTFYENPIHTKLKLNGFINTKRSEDNFVNKLKATYKEDISVIMGDWNDAGRTVRFQTSSKTKGWQKVFRRNHVPFYLLDEHKTSKYCPTCESSTHKPFTRPSPRPWRASQGQIDTVSGLLGCNNLKCIKQDGPTRFWNRDALSTSNMLKIVRGTMDTGIRPILFSRSSNSS